MNARDRRFKTGWAEGGKNSVAVFCRGSILVIKEEPLGFRTASVRRSLLWLIQKCQAVSLGT